jgi:hypothetical protein
VRAARRASERLSITDKTCGVDIRDTKLDPVGITEKAIQQPDEITANILAIPYRSTNSIIAAFFQAAACDPNAIK